MAKYKFYIVVPMEDAHILHEQCFTHQCTFDSWKPAVGPGRHCHVEGEGENIAMLIRELQLPVQPVLLNAGYALRTGL